MTEKTINKTVKKTTPAPVEEVKETSTPELSKEDKQEVRIIERVIESKEIAPADAFGKLTRPQITLIKNTIAKGASDDELKMFIQVCKGAQLNPFLKQVFLVPRWDSRAGREVRTIQVSIDGFRSIAESSNAYAGNDDPVYDGEQEIDTGRKPIVKIIVPLKATTTVHKMVEGQRYAFTATARWSEYYPGQKLGFQWHIRPYLMLGKCAEALALRKAFPKLLSGMYEQAELDHGAEVNVEAQKKQAGSDLLIDKLKECDFKTLENYREKVEKSDKYTAAQKANFAKAVDERMKELMANEASK